MNYEKKRRGKGQLRINNYDIWIEIKIMVNCELKFIFDIAIEIVIHI